jgi:hypothetical protein
MFKIIIFVVVSAVILFVSWSSLRNWQFHGFYRPGYNFVRPVLSLDLDIVLLFHRVYCTVS